MLRRTAVLLTATLSILLLTGPASGQGLPATVTVLHGIPGEDLGLDPALPVDVFVSGLGCALADFRYGDVSPRVEAPAGRYDVAVSLADPAAPCSGPVVIDAPGVRFDADENYTLVAHLTGTGDLTVTRYTNDVSPARFREGRLALHHVAAVGAVDIKVYGIFPFRGFDPRVALDGVTNPLSAAADLKRGYYVASIAPAGGAPIAYQFLKVTSDETLLVYATGSLTNGTFQLLVDGQGLRPRPAPGAEAIVSIIHGIPGGDLGLDPDLPVDVFVSGLGCAVTDFRFGDIVSRLAVPAGTYDIQVSLVDEAAGPCAGPIAIDAPGVPFAENENATVIANLSADGTPTASKFTNDLSKAGAFEGRLIVHHTAAVDAVDVGVLRRFLFFFYFRVALFEDVVNGDVAEAVVPQHPYSIDFGPAGGSPLVRERAAVRAGEATLVYAVGSLANGTFEVLFDRQPLE